MPTTAWDELKKNHRDQWWMACTNNRQTLLEHILSYSDSSMAFINPLSMACKLFHSIFFRKESMTALCPHWVVIHGHEQVPLPTNPLQMRKLFEVMKKRGLESLLKQIIQKKLFVTRVDANKSTVVGLSPTFSFEIIQYIIRGNKVGVDEKIQIKDNYQNYQGTVAHIFCYEGLIHKKNKGHPVFQILKYICEISNSSSSESVDSNNRTVRDLLKELDLEQHSILQPVLTSMSQSESQSSQHSPSHTPEKHVPTWLGKFTNNTSPKKVLEEKIMVTEEQEEIELPPKLSPTPTKKRKPQMIVMGTNGFSTPTRTKPKEISPTKRPQTIETSKKRKTRSKDVKYDTDGDCEDASPEPNLSTKGTRVNSSNKPKTRSRVLESTKDDCEDEKPSIKPEPSSKKDSPNKRPQTIETSKKIHKTRSTVVNDESSESEDETMTDTLEQSAPQTPELVTCAMLSDEEGDTEDESTVRDIKNITRSSKKRKVEMVNVIVISDDEEEDFYESETDTE